MNSAGFITSLESSGRRLIRSGRPQGSNRITPKLTMKDRKSTRLNSSHLVISYAVFCLKKKKKHADAGPDLLYSSLAHADCGAVLQRRIHPLRGDDCRRDCITVSNCDLRVGGCDNECL